MEELKRQKTIDSRYLESTEPDYMDLIAEVQRAMMKFGHRRDEAEDIASDAVVAAFDGWQKGWLTAEGVRPMAHKMARGKGRKSAVNNQQLVSEGQLALSLEAPESFSLGDMLPSSEMTADLVEKSFRSKAIRDAIGRLKPSENVVIICHYMFHDTFGAIAYMMERSERHIQRIHSDAIKKLSADPELVAFCKEP